MSKPQGTFLLKHLLPGTIYRDVLSWYLVLVMEVPVPHGQAKKEQPHLVGLYWNPIYGSHQTMELHDHQLVLPNNQTL